MKGVADLREVEALVKEHLERNNATTARVLAELLAEVNYMRTLMTFYESREKHFASVLRVADCGKYRADWDGAIERLIRERDALRSENEALRNSNAAKQEA